MLRPLLRLLLMLNRMLIQASPDAHPPIPPPDSVHKTPVQVKPPVCHYVPVKHCENVPTHSLLEKNKKLDIFPESRYQNSFLSES